MKQLLFLFFFSPFFASAQCEKFVDGSPELTSGVITAAAQYLEFPLDTARINVETLDMRDEKEWCKVIISYKTKAELVGTEAKTFQAGIRSIYISGPWERIQKLYSDYFLPKTSCGNDYSATVRFWDGQKIVHIQDGTKQGISLGFIRIETERL